MIDKELHNKEEGFEQFKIGYGKRLFDILFSIFALIFFSPVIFIIAIAIKLESKGPIIFSQPRVGTGYNIFTFYKFRTMYVDAEKYKEKLASLNAYLKNFKKYSDIFENEECPECKKLGKPCSPMLYIDGVEICENNYLRIKKNRLMEQVFFKAKNDPRITYVGKIIRRYHFDELPQFYNVLKGDMSVVGNRPLPLYEAEKLTTDEWAYRFLAPAGITGLWQIKAGDIHNPEERIALDNQYAMIAGPWTDFKILIKTILTFLSFSKASY